MKQTTTLGKLTKVPLREAWRHEANDFTPWLAKSENLDELATTLGLSELEFVATEHLVGDFKLDILCTTDDYSSPEPSETKQYVIIENQLDETDHKHLGQILAYAAGVKAHFVVWIAETFRPEHAAALQFLNENTTNDLSFFGVQIELWRIDDSTPAPKFEVIVKPNHWTKTGREQARVATSMSPTRQLQQQFWVELIAHLAKHAPQIRPQKPHPRHWLNNTIGRSGFRLNMTANTLYKRLSVEIYIRGENAKSYYAELLKHRESIHTQLGFPLDWQELPDSVACRIAIYYSNASIEDEQRWNEYMEWMTLHLIKMDAVFRPIIRTLPQL